MTIFFVFSDESGNYRQERNIRFNQKNPYYLRVSLLIRGDDWLFLDNYYRQLKREFDLPSQTEIKYSDVWTIINYQRDNSRKLKTRLIPLKDYPIEKLVEFINETIHVLEELQYARIVITVTKNSSIELRSEEFIYKTHLQNLMQRVQLEIGSDSNPGSNDNLCLLFIDPINPQINKLLTNSYNELFLNGDYFTHFSAIKDCLHFELSHHSSGIQVADFIAGTTYGYLNDREDSRNLFDNHIRPYLRQSNDGKIMGWGIIEIPRDEKVRQILAEMFCVS